MRPAEKLSTFDVTYERIRALPAGVTGEILEPGAIRTMSRPARAHRFTAKRIVRALGSRDYDEGEGNWVFEVEAELRLLGTRLLVPDLAGWRVTSPPLFLDHNPIEQVPQWACEVLSPTTARDDRVLKLPLYARAGVEWIWLVDPDARYVEVFQSRDGLPVRVAAAQDDDPSELPPFEGAMEIGRWWLPHAETTPGASPDNR